MAKQLAHTVHVTNPESRRLETFTAGETPPAWAADLITNDAAWGDKVDAEVAEAAEEGPPVKSASKPDWVAYAVSQGMSEDEADDHTRDELATIYLGE